jgi:hypothetical protein
MEANRTSQYRSPYDEALRTEHNDTIVMRVYEDEEAGQASLLSG